MQKTNSSDWLPDNTPGEQGTPGVRKWSRSEAEDTVPMSDPEGRISQRPSVPVAGPTAPQASAYVSARPPPAISPHRTFEMDSIKIADELDPRRAATMPRMRAPALDGVTPEPARLDSVPPSSLRDDVEPAVLSQRGESPLERSARGITVGLWAVAIGVALLGGVLLVSYRTQLTGQHSDSTASASDSKKGTATASLSTPQARTEPELATACTGPDPTCGQNRAENSSTSSLTVSAGELAPSGQTAPVEPVRTSPTTKSSRESAPGQAHSAEPKANAADKKLWLE